MTSLEEIYRDDPQLLAHYQKKLLEPGWAGHLAPHELAHIRSELRKSSDLRRRWGFRPSARRLSEKRLREVAGNGLRAIDGRVLASVTEKERALPMFLPRKDTGFQH